MLVRIVGLVYRFLGVGVCVGVDVGVWCCGSDGLVVIGVVCGVLVLNNDYRMIQLIFSMVYSMNLLCQLQVIIVCDSVGLVIIDFRLDLSISNVVGML